MEKISKIYSKAVALPIDNVDTDQIIPARFLKATDKKGFGKNLFYDWRYDTNGNPNSDFVLNNLSGNEKILVAGKNFGCGSSREHAAWAIYDFGFRVVISSFFADIFKNNALNNGILPIQIKDEYLNNIFSKLKLNTETNFIIDLEEQILFDETKEIIISFELDPYKKECLLNLFDDINYLLKSKEEILNYEQNNSPVTW